MFECGKCGEQFELPASLAKHISDEHSDVAKTPPYVTLYECADCGEKFEKPEDLKSHMISVHMATFEPIPAAPDLCKGYFKHLSTLRPHIVHIVP